MATILHVPLPPFSTPTRTNTAVQQLAQFTVNLKGNPICWEMVNLTQVPRDTCRFKVMLQEDGFHCSARSATWWTFCATTATLIPGSKPSSSGSQPFHQAQLLQVCSLTVSLLRQIDPLPLFITCQEHT